MTRYEYYALDTAVEVAYDKVEECIDSSIEISITLSSSSDYFCKTILDLLLDFVISSLVCSLKFCECTVYESEVCEHIIIKLLDSLVELSSIISDVINFCPEFCNFL